MCIACWCFLRIPGRNILKIMFKCRFYENFGESTFIRVSYSSGCAFNSWSFFITKNSKGKKWGGKTDIFLTPFYSKKNLLYLDRFIIIHPPLVHIIFYAQTISLSNFIIITKHLNLCDTMTFEFTDKSTFIQFELEQHSFFMDTKNDFFYGHM